MKSAISIILLAALLCGLSAAAAVNARNGIAISTDSTINGRSLLSAVNGQSLAAGVPWIVATGGTVTDEGNFRTHTFTSNGTFTVTASPGGATVHAIVLASGGGGQLTGGGAGGYVYNFYQPISVQSYSIVIGAASSLASAGNNSTFSDIVALGGGVNGSSGGSGSGGQTSSAGGAATQPGSASGGYGFAGGTGLGSGNDGGGGGAGSAAAGRSPGAGRVIDFGPVSTVAEGGKGRTSGSTDNTSRAANSGSGAHAGIGSSGSGQVRVGYRFQEEYKIDVLAANSQYPVLGYQSLATVKLFAAGGQSGVSAGGSGGYLIVEIAVEPGDRLHFFNTGVNKGQATSVVHTRGGTVMGWAIAGAGGASGGDGANGGPNGGAGGYGGLIALAGAKGEAGPFAGGGFGGAAATSTTNGAGGAPGGGETGSDGSGPWSPTSGLGGEGGLGGPGGSDEHTGGDGGKGGEGYRGGGGGGGGGGTSGEEDKGDGAGGGGGGVSAIMPSSTITVTASGTASSLVDSDRGTAGNPDVRGKAVLILE